VPPGRNADPYATAMQSVEKKTARVARGLVTVISGTGLR
jgi:hypothetical protein